MIIIDYEEKIVLINDIFINTSENRCTRSLDNNK